MLSFGSIARGEDTSSSDLDIAIMIPGTARVVQLSAPFPADSTVSSERPLPITMNVPRLCSAADGQAIFAGAVRRRPCRGP
jgi:predicted nucleotidyltransferase